jgi:hypothetical protein
VIPRTIQIVRFTLDGLDHDTFAAHCEQVAPAFAGIPGLISKAWLGDERAGIYGGVYAWRDRAAMDAYVAGDVFAAVRVNPAFAGVTTEAYDVLAAPSRITAPGAGDTAVAAT